MTHRSDYILDIDGLADEEDTSQEVRRHSLPFICVLFECCSVYSRIYRRKDGSRYVGWCPRCARKVYVRVGPGGVSTRFFKAT